MDLDLQKVHLFAEESELEKCIDAYHAEKSVLFGVYFYKEDEFDSDYCFWVENLTPIIVEEKIAGRGEVYVENYEPRKSVSSLYVSQFLKVCDVLKGLKEVGCDLRFDFLFYTMDSTFSFVLKDLEDDIYQNILKKAEEKGPLFKQDIEFMYRMNERMESKVYRISDEDCKDLEVLLKQYHPKI